MNPALDKLRETLRAVEAGQLDQLTPEQVSQLEQALNGAQDAAAKLADRRPALDPGLSRALDELERPALPSDAAWDAVWQQVEAAAPVKSNPLRPGAWSRVIRVWRPLAAAAACLILAAVWRGVTASGPASDAWPLQLASDVEINELEVYDGATPMIMNIGGANGPEVIWVLQDDDTG